MEYRAETLMVCFASEYCGICGAPGLATLCGELSIALPWPSSGAIITATYAACSLSSAYSYFEGYMCGVRGNQQGYGSWESQPPCTIAPFLPSCSGFFCLLWFLSAANNGLLPSFSRLASVLSYVFGTAKARVLAVRIAWCSNMHV